MGACRKKGDADEAAIGLHDWAPVVNNQYTGVQCEGCGVRLADCSRQVRSEINRVGAVKFEQMDASGLDVAVVVEPEGSAPREWAGEAEEAR